MGKRGHGAEHKGVEIGETILCVMHERIKVK